MESVVEKNALLTLGDILRVVAMGHERTAIVIDHTYRLHGVVSQGDLLKAIWNGASLLDPVEDVINPNPLMIVEGSEVEIEALRYFVEYGALLIPVVDAQRKLVRLVNVREIIKKITVKPDLHGEDE